MEDRGWRSLWVTLRSLSRAWRKFGSSSCAVSSAETDGRVELSGRKLEIHLKSGRASEVTRCRDTGRLSLPTALWRGLTGSCLQVRLHKKPMLRACQEDSGERFRAAFEKDGCRSDEGKGSGPGQGTKSLQLRLGLRPESHHHAGGGQ